MRQTCLALMLFASTLGAWGEPLCPPEGARLVGSNPVVKLSWEGPANEYYLQVLAADRIFFEGPVRGHSHNLKLAPNVYYTWTAVPGTNKGYLSKGDVHHFQHSSQVIYNFDGAPGTPGGPGKKGPELSDGEAGLPGGPGQPGQNVDINLSQAGEFVLVNIQAQNQKTEFLLLPNSSPLIVTSRGGQGGPGGPGGEGAPGYFDNNTNDHFFLPPSNGGPGGEGGNGGNGGTIIAHSSISGGARKYLILEIGRAHV